MCMNLGLREDVLVEGNVPGTKTEDLPNRVT